MKVVELGVSLGEGLPVEPRYFVRAAYQCSDFFCYPAAVKDSDEVTAKLPDGRVEAGRLADLLAAPVKIAARMEIARVPKRVTIYAPGTFRTFELKFSNAEYTIREGCRKWSGRANTPREAVEAALAAIYPRPLEIRIGRDVIYGTLTEAFLRASNGDLEEPADAGSGLSVLCVGKRGFLIAEQGGVVGRRVSGIYDAVVVDEAHVEVRGRVVSLDRFLSWLC